MSEKFLLCGGGAKPSLYETKDIIFYRTDIFDITVRYPF